LRPLYADGYDLSTREGRLAAIAASSKPYAIIIDHVGNIARHAIARDCPYTGRLVVDLCHREWSLDRRDKRSRGKPLDVIPVTNCRNPVCLAVYERTYRACPFCGFVIEPASRAAPEFVDGDLYELDAAALARLRGDVDAIADRDLNEYREELQRKYMPDIAVRANVKRMVERQVVQHELKETINQWGGWMKAAGKSDSEGFRRFWFKFGTDVLTAQTMPTDEMNVLRERISADINDMARGVI
jgi:hypothetical protein